MSIPRPPPRQGGENRSAVTSAGPPRSLSPSTILRFSGVSLLCDPVQPIDCASSYPIPRVEFSSRGDERHILCRRSGPHARDPYQDKDARFQTPREHRSISRVFHWKPIARPVSRLRRSRHRPQVRGHSRRESCPHGTTCRSPLSGRLRAIDGNHREMHWLCRATARPHPPREAHERVSA